MSSAEYLTPLQVGAWNLKNRVIFAPCTRNRGHVPGPLQAIYYAQRAQAGLIISEATMPESQGYEYSNAPGITEPEQIAGWKKVTEAVHAAGGLIIMQVMNIGRVAHPILQAGKQNYGPSAIAAAGGRFKQLNEYPHVHNVSHNASTDVTYVQPAALVNPQEKVDNFRQAFKNAKEAGFDGVEVHGANGYLVHQFLDSSANKRTDEWGGSPEKRCKFALDVTKAAIDVWGADRVGIKLSPSGGFNDMGMTSSETLATYTYLLKELDDLKIAYVHVQRWFSMFDPASRGTVFEMSTWRGLYKGTLLANGDYTPAEGKLALAHGDANAMVFGRHFIANPDLPKRAQEGLPLNAFDMSTAYVPGEKGYVDYPRWDELSDDDKEKTRKAWAKLEQAHDEDRKKVPELLKQQAAREQEVQKERGGPNEFIKALEPIAQKEKDDKPLPSEKRA